MYCSTCGTQIPDEANFCWKCGKPQKADGKNTAQASSNSYEMCEIEIISYVYKGKFLGMTNSQKKYAFRALAIGPEGKYEAGRSGDIVLEADSIDTKRTQPKEVELDSLIKILSKDGWQPLPSGTYWYSYRFQRSVK